MRRLAAALLVLVLMACAHQPAPASGTSVRVTEKDFRIVAMRTALPAGGVSFDILNRGPSTHELVLVRTDLAASDLPLRPDGLTIDEDSPLLHPIAEDGDIALGESRTLSARLAPGHYVLFCNLEGHYLGGMRLSLEVTTGAGSG